MLCLAFIWFTAVERLKGTPMWTDDVAYVLEKVRDAKGLSRLDARYLYEHNHQHIDWNGDWGDILLRNARPRPPGYRDPQFSRVENIYATLEKDLDFLRRYLSSNRPAQSIPELSTEERKMALLNVRNQIYDKAKAQADPKQGDQVFPYSGHLTLVELNEFVSSIQERDTPPWLWISDDGRRYLLRQKLAQQEYFYNVNRFVSDAPHKIFISVWQEIEDPDSNKWQYLGVFKGPERRKWKKYREGELDQDHYPIPRYDILSRSTIRVRKE